ncbi:MAG: tannase/feruloyl esterase family alpha/beta hydrolase [Oceanospirillaceae bacterium]|nr:tannase/feruloyl esterase family alpha/beta hydrolase [Oceanospirillaceae bacterium]
MNKTTKTGLTGIFAASVIAIASHEATAALPQLSPATPANIKLSCEQIASNFTFANTHLTEVISIAAGELTLAKENIPQHCLVTGKMYPRKGIDGKDYAIGFEMRLPTKWNGRYFYQGNGGIDGSVKTALGITSGGGPLTGALMQGFAVISSDAGHSSRGPSFGLDPQARLDYGYQAVGKLTPMAKSLIATAYGKGPDRSYIGGCSNGGRHTMVAATRYASDYDGYLIGSPGFNLPQAAVANIGGAKLYASIPGTDLKDLSTAFTGAERAMLVDKILQKCDALDGVSDGIVQDRNACQSSFDINRDIASCTAGRDGSCLTIEQKSAIGKIFSGVTTSNGKLIYASFPWDSGIASPGVQRWEYKIPVQRDSGAVAKIFKTPPAPAEGFNGSDFVFNTSIDTMVTEIWASNAAFTESGMAFMTPQDPTQMGAVKDRGAKILAYHGTSDAIFSLDDTVAWYEGLSKNNGGDASDFAKLYPVPAMGHCRGGPATDQFDLLTELVAWVEEGQEPTAVIASARGVGNAGGVNKEVPANWSATRTRPLCPHPQVARYNSGDIELASSFSCQ